MPHAIGGDEARQTAGKGDPRVTNDESHHKANLRTLILGTIGIVFGDIGTSPLYALKETMAGHHPIAVAEATVLGVLSLIFWAVTLLVSVKYVDAHHARRQPRRGRQPRVAGTGDRAHEATRAGAPW